MNFFCPDCQEPPINTSSFGLCDNQDGTKAYTNSDDPSLWTAEVKNDKKIPLIFTAIDKCVIKDNEEIGRGRCDGMLTSAEDIYFVELKNQRGNWKTNAINQLESTIRFFISNHDITVYKHKKAFACNKKHPCFQETDNERNLYFFRKYGIRLDVQAKIIVV